MVRINSRPAILRKLGSELRTLKGKHRVAQQRRFLATRKRLQLKQFRANQKLELQGRREQIRAAKQHLSRVKQLRFAQKTAKLRKFAKGTRKIIRAFR